ncbi:toxin-antitoxin system HicB family antitoxin [Streptomyces niveiscabiei]|uniref:toxin-antitoxin system HicB family antitoxin n=1 Tax=Streptomyces niveiscabiei TaxID=164115 RepID=UPI000ABCA167|nr:toxin-antitoxin system HicB family antitoxin [Streptomyces niveiscabiei]
MTAVTVDLPDDVVPSLTEAARTAGLTLSEYVARVIRHQVVFDGARQLAALGIADDLCGEGDSL